jgi:hypothetical protein
VAKVAATTVIPLVVAVTSLLFSVFTWWATNRPPEVALGIPSVVRIVQDGDDAWVYVQPHLISTGTTDRVAVVSGLSATVSPAEGGQAVPFAWEERGTWTYDEATQALGWQFVADPSPLLVGPSTPQSPVALMESTEAMTWAPGEYRVVLTVDQVDAAPLRTEFRVDVSEQAAAQLTDSSRFVEVPVR